MRDVLAEKCACDWDVIMYATSRVRAVIIKTDNVLLDLEDHNYKGYLQEEKQTKLKPTNYI
jgi:hypothetical protein